ncbi:MFS transporter [Paraburkholderia sp. EG286B]|uniref:MFS transporter n=1 Tax=Paraburkholderia sp. EG286B TaxID=3237011 RepID=UPI0034D2C743
MPRADTSHRESGRSPSARSLRGLDALSFLMADVRDGIGPFLAVFLKGTLHWSSADIGLVMGASGLAAALSQIPAGMLVDATRAKRAVIALSAGIVAAGCLLIARFPTLPVILVTQVALALVSAVVGPSLAALSLGVVGHRMLAARVSRNEGFNHAGNVTAAVLAAMLGQYAGTVWLFWLVCMFAAASATTVLLVRPSDIDHELARGGEVLRTAEGRGRPVPLSELVQRRDVMMFLATVVLFHFGNAAMLPLAGQMIARAAPGQDVVALGACMIAAQLVMVVVAAAVGRAVRAGVGRRKIFLVALAVLPLRGLLFALTDNPYAVVAIQLLDGISAGIFGVIATVIASDLMRGTGRFSLGQGAISLAVGIGAGLSNLTGGFVVDRLGFPAGFLALATVAIAAFALFALFMPETREYDDPAPVPPEHALSVPGSPRSTTNCAE